MPSSSRRRRGRGRGQRSGRKTKRNWADLPMDAISAVLRPPQARPHRDPDGRRPGVPLLAQRRAGQPLAVAPHRHVRPRRPLQPGQSPRDGAGRRTPRQGTVRGLLGRVRRRRPLPPLPWEQAPSLKSLRLISCYNVSNEGFAEAIKKLPLIEELELSLSNNVFGQEVFETVGKSCPHLKRFRLSEHGFYSFEDADYNKNGEALGIATMTELRSLQIFGNNLTNEGLTAILDNCHHLEFLDIRHCFNVEMDNTLQAKCAGIKTLRLPDDSTDDYDFIVSAPVWADDSQSEDNSDDRHTGSDIYYELDTELDDDIYDPSTILMVLIKMMKKLG